MRSDQVFGGSCTTESVLSGHKVHNQPILAIIRTVWACPIASTRCVHGQEFDADVGTGTINDDEWELSNVARIVKLCLQCSHHFPGVESLQCHRDTIPRLLGCHTQKRCILMLIAVTARVPPARLRSSFFFLINGQHKWIIQMQQMSLQQIWHCLCLELGPHVQNRHSFLWFDHTCISLELATRRSCTTTSPVHIIVLLGQTGLPQLSTNNSNWAGLVSMSSSLSHILTGRLVSSVSNAL